MANRWSSTQKYVDVTLSGGDLIATNTASAPARSVRSVGSVTAGKVYCELLPADSGTDPDYFSYLALGICNEDYDATLSQSPGYDVGADSWLVRLEFQQKLNNGSTAPYAIGNFNAGDVFHIAVDMDAKKVWFGRNNTFIGDPTAGTGEAYTFTGSECYVLGGVGFFVATIQESVTARFASGDWVYTPPVGFEGEWPATGSGALGPDVGALTLTGPAPTAFIEPNTGDAEAPLSLSISATGQLGKNFVGGTSFSLAIEGTGETIADISGASFSLEIQGIGGAATTSDSSANLPLVVVTGQGISGTVGTAAGSLPLLQVVGYSSGEAALVLPLTTITAEGAMGALGNAALVLPRLQLTASGDATNWIDGALILPKVVVDASGVVGSIGSSGLVLPRLVVAGFGADTNLATGVVVLPLVEALGSAYLGNIGGSTLLLPLLRIQSSFASAAFSDEWVTLNPEALAHTRYTLTGVTAVGELNGQVYLATSAGVYLLSGDDDDGTAIASITRSGLTDFRSDFLKTAANLYVGYNTDGVLNTVIGTDGGTSYTYALSRDLLSSGQRGARAPLGRGLRSRYWQVGFENVAGADFTLDTFALTLRNLKRKS